MPVTGSITQMWNIDEESGSSDEDEVSSPLEDDLRTPLLDESTDPFKMLLPFCRVSQRARHQTDVSLRFAFPLTPSTRSILFSHIFPLGDSLYQHSGLNYRASHDGNDLS